MAELPTLASSTYFQAASTVSSDVHTTPGPASECEAASATCRVLSLDIPMRITASLVSSLVANASFSDRTPLGHQELRNIATIDAKLYTSSIFKCDFELGIK
jgi:hypothetical protein